MTSHEPRVAPNHRQQLFVQYIGQDNNEESKISALQARGIRTWLVDSTHNEPVKQTTPAVISRVSLDTTRACVNISAVLGELQIWLIIRGFVYSVLHLQLFFWLTRHMFSVNIYKNPHGALKQGFQVQKSGFEWTVREITKSSSTFSATNISSNIVWFLQLHDTIQMKSNYT